MGKEKRKYNKCSSNKKHNRSTKKNKGKEKTIIDPTETRVNYTTTTHTIKRIHPTHIKNVHRDVYRYEDYYPVTESFSNESYSDYYECGSDPNNSCCKKAKPCKKEKHCKRNK